MIESVRLITNEFVWIIQNHVLLTNLIETRMLVLEYHVSTFIG